MSTVLYARNPAGDREGVIEHLKTAEFIARHNDIGTWRVTGIPPTLADDLGLDLEGAGVELVRDGAVILSGPISTFDRSFDGNTDSVDVAGVDDNVWAARRLVSPEPGTAAPPYNVDAYDVRTGIVSTLMLRYFDDNAGPSALVPRRIPGLTVGADPLLGPSTTAFARWGLLIDSLNYLAGVAAAAGVSVGWRVRDLVFEVYAPVDLSGTVKFSVDLGTLLAFRYSRRAPVADYVFVGGGGEGTARTILEVQDAPAVAAWGRIELFRDRRDTTDPIVLAAAGNEELLNGAAQVGIAVTPIETDGRRFGVDYGLGDTVTVIVDGSPIVAPVVQVTLSIDDKGETVVPSVGNPATVDPVALFRKVRALERRTRSLEAV